MRTLAIALGVALIIGWAIFFWLLLSEPAADEQPPDTRAPAAAVEHNDRIRVHTPLPETVIASPLTVAGEARGMWFSEAVFPVLLTNWNGLIIAEGVARAESDWMSEAYVPFTAELVFESPYWEGAADFMRRGTLMLLRDNPSGLPEHDDAVEFTVYFAREE